MNDLFDDIFPPSDDIGGTPIAPRGSAREALLADPAAFWEPCAKCHGTGSTPWGVCFRCNGAKGKSFKTSPEARAKARAGADHRKAELKKAYEEEFKAELAWVRTTATREETKMGLPPFKYWEFPGSLLDAYTKYGSFTDGQLAAIRKCMARDAERKAENAANAKTAPAVDISGIEKAFAAAAAKGKKKLKLFLGAFEYSPAGANSRNPGATYVKKGNDYLGKIVAGKFHKAYGCTEETAAAIIEHAGKVTDFESIKVLGRDTGVCCCCGAELTDPDSIAAGIGPICAKKWGF